MMLLAELLSNFLPGKVKSRLGYLWSAVLLTAVTFLVISGLARFFGQEWDVALRWPGIAAGCVALGYALVYPFVRGRLTDAERARP
ncbi:hypothetical protein [Streptomyces sp. NPDC051219]|uniref:hypothetical protein n=1 Tax=Streptomyces sp. NPDC051219 TaxID=3155283 RepID=UPI00342F2741